MILELSGHGFGYECENLCRLFFPYSPVKRGNQNEAESGESSAVAVIRSENEKYIYTVALTDGGKKSTLSLESAELSEYQLTSLLYKLFSEFTGIHPAWGMLTGIHPVKLLRALCEKNGDEQGEREFRDKYFVSPQKAALAKKTLDVQRCAIRKIDENDFCLYVSIPFCPSRCDYCSFVSQSIEKEAGLLEPYLALLEKELEKTAETVRKLNLRLLSVYVGGGTPTVLSATQLDGLCRSITELFSFSGCREFTVEAGRPDTITEEKLEALKKNGVSRISVNPQSLSDKVLENIGRRHTVADFHKAFEIARRAGFGAINADLIIGLEGDSLELFRNSLRGVTEAGADNVTIHSLAIKRAARLVQDAGALKLHGNSAEASEMMDYSVDFLSGMGFEPYYLYRQTRMAGNLENTGWAKNGKVCLYNIFTMDESLSVVACGAGGVSKLKDPYSPRLERIFNFKYPHEYISRHGEIIERKDGVTKLYEQFRERLH